MKWERKTRLWLLEDFKILAGSGRFRWDLIGFLVGYRSLFNEQNWSILCALRPSLCFLVVLFFAWKLSIGIVRLTLRFLAILGFFLVARNNSLEYMGGLVEDLWKWLIAITIHRNGGGRRQRGGGLFLFLFFVFLVQFCFWWRYLFCYYLFKWWNLKEFWVYFRSYYL